MPIYIVKPGDCLTKIAAAYGFGDYKTIYDHPANAAFKKKRPNPHVIQPGDKLFIPETIPLTGTFETGRRHQIVIKRPRANVQVYVKDADGEPFKGKEFVLRVVGEDDVSGSTDGDGLAKADVPAQATEGRLEFPDDGIVFSLRLGSLDPLTEETGVRARLSNLGYHCPESSDVAEQSQRTSQAVARLQSENGLDVTGDVDQATRDLLKQAHDRGEES